LKQEIKREGKEGIKQERKERNDLEKRYSEYIARGIKRKTF